MSNTQCCPLVSNLNCSVYVCVVFRWLTAHACVLVVPSGVRNTGRASESLVECVAIMNLPKDRDVNSEVGDLSRDLRDFLFCRVAMLFECAWFHSGSDEPNDSF